MAPYHMMFVAMFWIHLTSIQRQFRGVLDEFLMVLKIFCIVLILVIVIQFLP